MKIPRRTWLNTVIDLLVDLVKLAVLMTVLVGMTGLLILVMIQLVHWT